MDSTLAAEKKWFLENEIGTLSIIGAMSTRDGENRIYRAGVSDSRKGKFKKAVRSKLSAFHTDYSSGTCSGEAHVRNIGEFARALSAEFSDDLHGTHLRIGISQKLLNLYLKYLWTLGWIPEPPHCPFDSNIIKKLNLRVPLNWKSLDSIGEYLQLVDAANILASAVGQSIAEWESYIWRP